MHPVARRRLFGLAAAAALLPRPAVILAEHTTIELDVIRKMRPT